MGVWIIRQVANGSKRWVLLKKNSNSISANNKKIHAGCKIYMTLDNGGYPFVVCIKASDVRIYRTPNNNEWTQEFYKDFYKNPKKHAYLYTKLVGKPLKAQKIFVGKWPKYDSNSILIEVAPLEYVFIGSKIFKFKSFAEIVKYHSPIGNSEVSYPCAIDKDGRFYLLLEGVVVEEELMKEFMKKYKLDYKLDYISFSNKDKKDFKAQKLKNMKIIQKQIF